MFRLYWRLARTGILLLALFAPFMTARAGSQLDIDPQFQETPEWCWVTVGEMVFRYYGVADINPVGNFQCGIIALLGPACNMNCGNCVVPAGRLATIRNMLVQYSQTASAMTHTSTYVHALATERALSMDDIKDEIDANRPIVAGVSPSGNPPSVGSEHVALIVGYDGSDVIVNDPFPYDRVFPTDPYTAAGGHELKEGQYQIDRDTFVARLKWRESVYDIRCSGSDCEEDSHSTSSAERERSDADNDSNQQEYGRSCQTSYGRCGPFYNQPALPLGAACWCPTRFGPASGEVVP